MTNCPQNTYLVKFVGMVFGFPNKKDRNSFKRFKKCTKIFFAKTSKTSAEEYLEFHKLIAQI